MVLRNVPQFHLRPDEDLGEFRSVLKQIADHLLTQPAGLTAKHTYQQHMDEYTRLFKELIQQERGRSNKIGTPRARLILEAIRDLLQEMHAEPKEDAVVKGYVRLHHNEIKALVSMINELGLSPYSIFPGTPLTEVEVDKSFRMLYQKKEQENSVIDLPESLALKFLDTLKSYILEANPEPRDRALQGVLGLKELATSLHHSVWDILEKRKVSASFLKEFIQEEHGKHELQNVMNGKQLLLEVHNALEESYDREGFLAYTFQQPMEVGVYPVALHEQVEDLMQKGHGYGLPIHMEAVGKHLFVFLQVKVKGPEVLQSTVRLTNDLRKILHKFVDESWQEGDSARKTGLSQEDIDTYFPWEYDILHEIEVPASVAKAFIKTVYAEMQTMPKKYGTRIVKLQRFLDALPPL